MDFINKQTIQTAKDLLGVKIIYQDEYQYYSGYIVETEAYLGFKTRLHMVMVESKLPKSPHYTKMVGPYTHMSCIPFID